MSVPNHPVRKSNRSGWSGRIVAMRNGSLRLGFVGARSRRARLGAMWGQAQNPHRAICQAWHGSCKFNYHETGNRPEDRGGHHDTTYYREYTFGYYGFNHLDSLANIMTVDIDSSNPPVWTTKLPRACT